MSMAVERRPKARFLWQNRISNAWPLVALGPTDTHTPAQGPSGAIRHRSLELEELVPQKGHEGA